jgi:hypothetical protein
MMRKDIFLGSGNDWCALERRVGGSDAGLNGESWGDGGGCRIGHDESDKN